MDFMASSLQFGQSLLWRVGKESRRLFSTSGDAVIAPIHPWMKETINSNFIISLMTKP